MEIASSGQAARIRLEGEEGLADLIVLEEDIRRGRLVGDGAELLYPPWTGDFYLRLDEIPALSDAFSAPAARLAAQLRRREVPWVTLALSAAILACAAAQSTLSSEAQQAWLAWGRVGWDAALLDGRWWTPWTAHLLHWPGAPFLHAFANVCFILYCGYRVEQVWGHGGVARVVAGSAAAGSLAVMAAGGLPVVGSSMLAFGLLGAQIAVGVRVGEALPPGRQGAYGWTHLLAFVLIFGLNKLIVVALTGQVAPAEGTSHVGHLGGLVGGVAAILAGCPGVLRPRRGRLRDLGATAGWLLLPLALALLLPLAPGGGGGWSWRRVEAPGVNLSARLPRQMAGHPALLAGLSGWRGDPNSEEPFLLDRMVYRSYTVREAFSWELWWSAHLGEELRPVPAPAAPEGGWVALAWEGPRSRVVEFQREEGLDVVRVAWRLWRDDPDDYGARERLYLRILEGVEIHAPPALAAQQAEYARFHDSPQEAYRYAEALWRAGRWAEADAVLAGLLAAGGRLEQDAARLRLQVLVTAPPGALPDPLPPPGWADPYVDAAPFTDMAMHRLAIRWLASQGACPEARARLERIGAAVTFWLEENPDQGDSALVIERALAEAGAAVEACDPQRRASRSGPSTSP